MHSAPKATEAVQSSNPFQIYIGWDSRESIASEVAAHSIKRRTRSPISIKYLKHRELRQQGNFARPWLIDANTGNFSDLIDGKPFSTEFSHTRFLIPHLMDYKGWALFMDADMIFLNDVKDLIALCDDKYAVMCVKHLHQPKDNTVKMDGRLQLQYHRKNWSSFVLWNCSHPANKELTRERVNYIPGRDLHAFNWLHDHEIGGLPSTYNYISGVSPKLPIERGNRPDVIHYTEGGPWFENCKEIPFSRWWMDEYEDWQREVGGVSSVPVNMQGESL